MDLSIVDNYPTEAAFGADYFTRAARGEVVWEGPDGTERRPEKVVITDRYLDYEGQICVGERTIRHLAHKFEMVDGWRVQRLIDDNHALRAELVELSQRCGVQDEQLRFLRALEAAPAAKVYLALDGTEHISARACAEATAKYLGIEPNIVTAAISVPLVEPEGAAS